jgi:hypothetical protein
MQKLAKQRLQAPAGDLARHRAPHYRPYRAVCSGFDHDDGSDQPIKTTLSRPHSRHGRYLQRPLIVIPSLLAPQAGFALCSGHYQAKTAAAPMCLINRRLKRFHQARLPRHKVRGGDHLNGLQREVCRK